MNTLFTYMTYDTCDPSELRHPYPEIPQGWDPRENKLGGHNIYSYNYNRWDELISWIQKSVRRGWIVDAVYCAIDGFLSGIGATLTNLWNRLLVMSVEDVGLANNNILPKIYYLSTVHKHNIRAIILAIILLAESRKTRLNDNHACSYALIDKNSIDKIKKLEEQIIKKRLLLAIKNNESVEYIDIHVSALIESTNKNGKNIKKYDHIAKIFCEAYPKNSYTELCYTIVSNVNWRHDGKSLLVITHLINNNYYGILETLSNLSVDDRKILDEKISEDDIIIEQMINDIINREFLLGTPDEALDKHTMRGRSLKRDLDQFLRVGARLLNEDMTYSEDSKLYHKISFGFNV